MISILLTFDFERFDVFIRSKYSGSVCFRQAVKQYFNDLQLLKDTGECG